MAVHESHGALPAPRFERPTRVLIAVAPFYRDIADALLAGATAAIAAAGATQETVEVPGALELPTAIRLASRSGEFDGYRRARLRDPRRDHALRDGLQRLSRGLMLLGLDGLCIGNGILTVERHAQAAVRADPAGQNKGGGAADAALHLIALARRFRPPARPLPEGSFRVAATGDDA